MQHQKRTKRRADKRKNTKPYKGFSVKDKPESKASFRNSQQIKDHYKNQYLLFVKVAAEVSPPPILTTDW